VKLKRSDPVARDATGRYPRTTAFDGEQPVEEFSGRETDILQMLCSEFSLPEIAQHFHVSYNTVKTHTRGIYRKLGVHGRSAAVAAAGQRGYL
jgi:LuxR family transcriptional regulator, maltose regulon positive regulatory protein